MGQIRKTRRRLLDSRAVRVEGDFKIKNETESVRDRTSDIYRRE